MRISKEEAGSERISTQRVGTSLNNYMPYANLPIDIMIKSVCNEKSRTMPFIIKEWKYEDYRRKRWDLRANNQVCTIVRLLYERNSNGNTSNREMSGYKCRKNQKFDIDIP